MSPPIVDPYGVNRDRIVPLSAITNLLKVQDICDQKMSMTALMLYFGLGQGREAPMES
jgi:hypothetical protein